MRKAGGVPYKSYLNLNKIIFVKRRKIGTHTSKHKMRERSPRVQELEGT